MSPRGSFSDALICTHQHLLIFMIDGFICNYKEDLPPSWDAPEFFFSSLNQYNKINISIYLVFISFNIRDIVNSGEVFFGLKSVILQYSVFIQYPFWAAMRVSREKNQLFRYQIELDPDPEFKTRIRICCKFHHNSISYFFQGEHSQRASSFFFLFCIFC